MKRKLSSSSRRRSPKPTTPIARMRARIEATEWLPGGIFLERYERLLERYEKLLRASWMTGPAIEREMKRVRGLQALRKRELDERSERFKRQEASRGATVATEEAAAFAELRATGFAAVEDGPEPLGLELEPSETEWGEHALRVR